MYLKALIAKFSLNEPEGLERTFAVFEDSRTYFSGTTLPVIQTKYYERASGLIVPFQAAVQPAPINSTYRYLPLSELMQIEISLEKIIEIIQQHNQDDFISACAKFGDIAHPSNKDRELEQIVANYLPQIYQLASGYLLQNYKYFGPQATLVLMKLALAHGSNNPNLPKVNIELFVLLCLAIQDFFAPSDVQNTQNRVVIELPSNYKIHHRYDAAYEFRQYSTRWEGQSEVSVDLSNQYLNSMKFEVSTIASLAAGLASKERDLRINFQFQTDDENSEDSRMQKALERISAGIDTYAVEMKDPYQTNFIWDFGMFQRYPIVRRSDGRYVVVDQSFLLERGLGWHLVYDVVENYDEHEQKRFAAKVSALAEAQTVSLIERYLGDAWEERIVGGPEIIEVFGGHGIKSADVAVEFEDAWLIIEISALRPWFKALAATSEQDYEKLINQLVDEAVQSVSTSRRFIAHADTHFANFRLLHPYTKMYPIVVLTEKFAINPFALMHIRDKVKRSFSAVDSRIQAVEVMNLEEFETLLLLTERFGYSIVNLLSEKYESNFWSDSINNFLAHHYLKQLNELNTAV